MNFLNVILAALSAAAGYYALQILDAPKSLIMAGAFGSLACYALTLPAGALGWVDTAGAVPAPGWPLGPRLDARPSAVER